MFAKYGNCVVSKKSKGTMFRKLSQIMRNTQRNAQCVNYGKQILAHIDIS